MNNKQNYNIKDANIEDLQFVKDAKIFNIFEYAKNISADEKTDILSYVDRYMTRFLNEYKIICMEEQKCGCYLLRDYKDGVLLDEIFILPQFRGRGIASDIIKKIISKGQKVYLCVYKDNTKAIALYKRFGFSVIEDKEERYWMSTN